MKRSEILQILARRLSNRDVEDIQEAAILEMKFVQETVLQKFPTQPWFLQTEIVLPLAKADEFVELPDDYNALDTTGGVWIAPAELAAACEVLEVFPPEGIDSPLGAILNYDFFGGPAENHFSTTAIPDSDFAPECTVGV